jgi:hypothetical protein
MEKITNPNQHRDESTTVRRTVIPTPRSSAMFPGWGVRF